MEEKLTIKYADNGIIVHHLDSDILYVYETETEEGKRAAINELGSAIWYCAVEDHSEELEKDMRDFCNKHNCICDGVTVTIKIEPTYHPREK